MRFIPLCLIAAVLLGSACATTTKIVSEPPGAMVTSEKDSKDLGKTPLTYESKMWIWESEKVSVKAAGRKTKSIELKRSEADALPLVGGICLSLTGCGLVAGLPIILAGGMKMPAETKVSLDKEAEATPPPAVLNSDPAPASDSVAMGF